MGCARNIPFFYKGEELYKMEETKFELPNEVVTVKFIPRKKGMAANVGSDHIISGGMLTNATLKYCAPIHRTSGGVLNVLTKEEKDYLETETGLNLSAYGDFWKSFQVSLFKDDTSNKFDLSNPMDYISVAMLKKWSNEIAQGWSNRKNKATYKFVITGADEIPNEKKAKLDTKKEAFKTYGKIEDDKEKLLGVLKLLTNKTISIDSKLDWIQGQVEEYVDTDPTAFLRVINDSNFSTKLLIHKGIEHKIIIKKDNQYITEDGLELAKQGQIATFDNAVKYLADPANQEVRDLIEAKINSK